MSASAENKGIAPSSPAASSPLAPFGYHAFAVLWVATVVSNVGTWMNDVGAAWLMTELAPSPALVALVQTATTLPVFLFALPAGAIADIVDRRKMLLLVNVLMAIAAGSMTLLVWSDAMTVELLLLFTFLLGTGAAFIAPAWQAIVPGLVPREALPAAISLNSVGINVSRAIGPALAGVLIVSIGLYAPFLVNALSFIGIVLALWFWRSTDSKAGTLPAERLLPAMLAGLRYASHSPPLKRTILRALAFFIFASAYWAMLPLIARDALGGGSGLYGLLLGCVGLGAVGGAVALPKLRRHLEVNRLVLLGSLGTAAAIAIMASLPHPVAAAAAALVAGSSWIAVLSSFNVSAQTALPNWVRARGLSLFLTAFFGAMSAGALLWGLVAEQLGVAPALLIAAAAMAIVAPLALRIRLEPGDGSLHTASLHWPAAPVLPDDGTDEGPVMVTVDYRVDPERRAAFDRLMRRLRESRLRDGAYSWQLFRPLEEDGVLREAFMLASWQDHLHQHERVTEAERILQAEIKQQLLPGCEPVVRHHVPARALDG